VKLGLGTAQFGLDYGVSNKAGQTPAVEVLAILQFALENGITLVDTAAMYGSSEQRLGECLGNSDFRIVTKTPHFRKSNITSDDAGRLETTFRDSLRKLRRASVYGLLLHNCDDALTPGGERLFDRMADIQHRGLVEKFGVSAYTPEQVERVLDRFPITIVQVPYNVFDQRFERSGTLARLKSYSVEVHTRSAFLQGALLMDSGDLPAALNRHRAVFEQFHSVVREQGVSELQLALSFVLAQKLIDRVIVGACTAAQLSEIVAAAIYQPRERDRLQQLGSDDESLIDPSKWAASA
jgi:aryl-alcohol dehydrogenase-like predicted oxidoreductase